MRHTAVKLPVWYTYEMDHGCLVTPAFVSNCHEDTVLPYLEVVNGVHHSIWFTSMNDEIELFANTKVWNLVEVPEERIAVKTRYF